MLIQSLRKALEIQLEVRASPYGNSPNPRLPSRLGRGGEIVVQKKRQVGVAFYGIDCTFPLLRNDLTKKIILVHLRVSFITSKIYLVSPLHKSYIFRISKTIPFVILFISKK